MKQLFLSVVILVACHQAAFAQNVDFQNTVFFTRDANDSLILSGNTLGEVSLNATDRATHPLFNDGVYLPVTDCFNHNIWIRIRHIADDPNGTNVGINVPLSYNNISLSPIMIGGWAGFLYDFEIYADEGLTGAPLYKLGNLFPTSITVASLETLSGACGSAEWLSFNILNENSTGWELNSINFTGGNPYSNPGFSDTMAVYTTGDCIPPDGFSYTFPTGATAVSAISAGQFGFSEFQMSAGGVSKFQYGYEFAGQSSGYQGMSMAFGSQPELSVTSQDADCGEDNGVIFVSAIGIGPFSYSWNNGASVDSLVNLGAGSYEVTVTDQNGCLATAEQIIASPVNTEITIDGNTFTSSAVGATYQWINCGDFSIIPGATNQSFTGTPVGSYAVIVSDNGCTDTSACLLTSIASLNFDDLFSIYFDEANGSVKVHTSAAHKIIKANVYDMLGRMVVAHNEISTNPFYVKADFTSGVYCIVVQTDLGIGVKKFVKR